MTKDTQLTESSLQQVEPAVPVPEPESCWDEHADYPLADWQHEVAEDNTRLGYVEWVSHQQEADADDR